MGVRGTQAPLFEMYSNRGWSTHRVVGRRSVLASGTCRGRAVPVSANEFRHVAIWWTEENKGAWVPLTPIAVSPGDSH